MILLVAGLQVSEATAQLSGIRYTFSPGVDRMYFDGDAGLGDAYVLSGQLGFGFGEYLDLSASGRYSDRANTDFSNYDTFGEPEALLFDRLLPRDVELLQYGLDLKLNLATGRGIVPYIGLGTGILSLDPDGLDRTETIYLNGSVGVLYRWQDRITFTVEAQRQSWRMNAAALLSDNELTQMALARNDFTTQNTGAYTLGAGVSFDVGGRSRGQMTEVDRALAEQFKGGFSAVRLQVEPFWAWIKFDESLGFNESQRMTGVNLGVDLGSYTGLRGFYWRGLESEGSLEFDELAAYGGELLLRFGTPNKRIRPHLLVGGGYLNVLDGYEGNGVRTPEDSPFAMAGAGVSISSGRFFSLHGGVRSIFASTQDASDISRPSSVEASWMYYGGISFTLGRGGREERRDDPRTDTRADLTEIQILRAELRRQRELIAALAAGDSLAARNLAARDANARPMMMADSVRRHMVRTPAADRVRDWISVPVPEEGEIYIRFGPPAAPIQDAVYYLDPITGELRSMQSAAPVRSESGASLTPEEIRVLAREAAREVVAPLQRPAPADTAEMSEFTRRMDEVLRQLDRRLEEQDRISEAQPVGVAYPADGESSARQPFQFTAFMPLTGYNFNRPRTLLLGGRMELARDGSRFRMFNDLVFGVGSETTWSVGASLVGGFDIASLPDFRFYAGPGLGFLSAGDAQLVLNLLAGVSYPFGNGDVFGEFMTQDLFNNNRIQMGYRIPLE